MSYSNRRRHQVLLLSANNKKPRLQFAQTSPKLNKQFRLPVVILVLIEHCLNFTACLSVLADHAHPFMTTVDGKLLVALYHSTTESILVCCVTVWYAVNKQAVQWVINTAQKIIECVLVVC